MTKTVLETLTAAQKQCATHPSENAVTCPKCCRALKRDRELATHTGQYARKPILKPWEEGRW